MAPPTKKYSEVPEKALGQLFDDLSVFTESHALKGRILIAEEGINGTIAGSETNVKEFVEYLPTLEYCNLNGIDWKYSYGEGSLPFVDMYIKEASELISTGEAKTLIKEHTYFEPNSFGGIGGTGKHLNPQEFHNALESDPSAVVLDIRNDFEYDIGHFKGALSMKTNTFSETWRSLDNITAEIDQQCSESTTGEGKNTDVPPLPAQQRNYYMYCTGGIRCEKASVYLKAKGFDNVFQLQGGIHRYLEEFPDSNKKFLGRNFVFDSRMIDKESNSNSSVTTDIDVNHESSSSKDNFHESRDIIGRCVDCDSPHDTYTSDQRCAVCRQPLLICPKCKVKHTDTDYNEQLVPPTNVGGITSFQKDYHCKNHRYLKEVYFKNLHLFTINALHMQYDALRDLERDDAFLGKEHKKRRKTIRNQMDKIEQELAQRTHLNVEVDFAGKEVGVERRCGDDSKGKVVGGIWGT